ncbi:MAG: DNA-directed RNA polymerase, subunit E'' [Candidatus Methanomethylicia archaeon]|nr:DNA-directed RNA polymerase, subunit E'' [Candidatus Methanomethylicia archaeon]MCX8169060.1 DNA-directed RNA polymerase, subunit E'' [Candidatus Methanomethylicia archaeon]MDW7988792.1 transcription elongation factor subunit Spt4 [Nitrososphaerota archaeon]
MPKRGLPFKACRNCHYLVENSENKCPVCDSRDFSDDWSGLVIILNTNSETAKILNKKEVGRYAIEVH